MKRLLTTLCLLSFCVLPINDIGHTELSVTTVPDDSTPIKFKVCVITFGEYLNEKRKSINKTLEEKYNIDKIPYRIERLRQISILEKRLKTFLLRELRGLKNVDIVDFDDDWHFLLQYQAYELKAGNVTITCLWSEAVPKSHFKSYFYRSIEKPVLLSFPSAVVFRNADKLLEYAIEEIGHFDEKLQLSREQIRTQRELIRAQNE